MSLLTHNTATTHVTTPTIGTLTLRDPTLPNVSDGVYCPMDTSNQPTPNTQEKDDVLQNNALHNMGLHSPPKHHHP